MEDMLERIDQLEKELKRLKSDLILYGCKFKETKPKEETFFMWLCDKVAGMEEGKPFTATELLNKFDPSTDIIMILDDIRYGDPARSLGMQLTKYESVSLNGCILKRGSNGGRTTYRKVIL